MIVYITINAGMGHNVACHALQGQLCDHSSVTVELTKLDGGTINTHLINVAWRFLLAHHRWHKFLYPLAGMIFVAPMWRRLVLGSLLKPVCQRIKEIRPDLVVTTCSQGAWLLGELRRQNRITAPTVTFVTDCYTVGRQWFHRYTDYYLISSFEGCRRLFSFGAKKDNVHLVEYPLRPSITNIRDSRKESFSRSQAQNSLRLLVTAGGEGIGNVYAHLLVLINSGLPIQYEIVTGGNSTTYHRLLRTIQSSGARNVSVFGFVSNIDDLLRRADVFLGKAGTNLVFECLYYNLPIIVTQYMENEKGTLRYLLTNDFGWYSRSPKETLELVATLAANRKLISDKANNISRSHRTPSYPTVDNVVRSILAKQKGETVPQKLA